MSIKNQSPHRPNIRAATWWLKSERDGGYDFLCRRVASAVDVNNVCVFFLDAVKRDPGVFYTPSHVFGCCRLAAQRTPTAIKCSLIFVLLFFWSDSHRLGSKLLSHVAQLLVFRRHVTFQNFGFFSFFLYRKKKGKTCWCFSNISDDSQPLSVRLDLLLLWSRLFVWKVSSLSSSSSTSSLKNKCGELSLKNMFLIVFFVATLNDGYCLLPGWMDGRGGGGGGGGECISKNIKPCLMCL